MRRPGGVVRIGLVVALVAVLAAAVGCRWLTPHPPLPPLPPGAVDRAAPPPDAADGDRRVILHTRLIDQPAGDDYLTRGVWKECPDPLSHELSTLLAANGLRVGLASALPPRELERLAMSEASAVAPMLRTFQVNRPKAVPLNGPLEKRRLVTVRGLSETPDDRELEQVECGLLVTCTPAEGGKVTVRCEPQVQHGDRRPWLKPSADGNGFERVDRRAAEGFAGMAFEVTLDRKAVLVVGPADDRPDTLGGACFFVAEADRARQRVLVLQAGMSSDDPGEADRGAKASARTAAALTR